MCRFPLGKKGCWRDDDLLSHTPYPLKGPTRLRTPLILKGVNPPIRIRHPMRAGSLQGKEGCGKEVPVPFREKKGAGGMMIFFAHPLSPEGANAPIRIRHLTRAGSL
jgi:hypothetical protein